METRMIKSVDDLKKEILSVSVRVRKLENLSTNLTVKVTECESSCQGVSNLFDNADKQIKTNTRNIIHQDQRLKKLEENPNESNAGVFQHRIKLSTFILNRFRELLMYSRRSVFERCRLIKNHTQVIMVQKSCDFRSRSIVVSLPETMNISNLNFDDEAYWLYDTPFQIHRQFPKPNEDKRRKLYPVLIDAKRQGKHAVLVRDKVIINGSQYFVDDTDEATHVNRISYRDSLLTTPKEADRPHKRQRRSDSNTRG
jgi:hypothetical protein